MAGQFLFKTRPPTPSTASSDDVLAPLSLPRYELRERLFKEVERNPVVVAVERSEGAVELATAGPCLDLPVMEWLADSRCPSLRPPVHTAQEAHDGFMRSLPDRPESLNEKVHCQFMLVEGDPWSRWIGEQIVFNLDERGYVRGELVSSMNRALASRAGARVGDERRQSPSHVCGHSCDAPTRRPYRRRHAPPLGSPRCPPDAAGPRPRDRPRARPRAWSDRGRPGGGERRPRRLRRARQRRMAGPARGLVRARGLQEIREPLEDGVRSRHARLAWP